MASTKPDITITDYRTPTETNRGSDACHSVGIMNLTKAEVEALRYTVNALRRDRVAAERAWQSVLVPSLSIPPADSFVIGKGSVGPVGVSGQQGIGASEAMGGEYWSQRSKEFAQELKPDEPEEERNRFSGLDLD